MKLHLDKWWENGLVFKIARTKMHQNFLYFWALLSFMEDKCFLMKKKWLYYQLGKFASQLYSSNHN